MSIRCWGAIESDLHTLQWIVMSERCLTAILLKSALTWIFLKHLWQFRDSSMLSWLQNHKKLCHITTYRKAYMCSTAIRQYFILYCTGKETHEQVTTHVLTRICNQSWSILLPIFLFCLLLESADFVPFWALGGKICEVSRGALRSTVYDHILRTLPVKNH